MANWEISNNTECGYQENKTLHQLFEEQVQKQPDCIALIHKDQAVTYSELYRKALSVACYLRENDAQNNSIVCVCLERSIDMIIGIYGVLLAGLAYLPLDVNWPERRIKSIIKDSSSKIILTNTNKLFFGEECKVIDMNEIPDKPGTKITNTSKPTDIAYVIYTSGSTGNPKGVLIEHHSVINRISWMQRKYKLTCNDTLLLKTPYFFDVSVWELFWWYFGGAKLCILEPGFEKFPQALIGTISKYHVSKIHFIPSLLSSFLKYAGHQEAVKLKSLDIIFCSGEKLEISHYRQFKDLFGNGHPIMLVNLYGPTEATVDVTYYHCEKDNYTSIPIGKPIDNTKIFILDSDEIQGCHKPGEICIAGVGLARGYLNCVELSSKMFDYYEKLQVRIYKTGDQGMWLDDGNIEYIGRKDNQVKIRGIRIELGEIEYAILSFKYVKECVVRLIKKNENIIYIVAYIVPATNYLKHELTEFLKNTLPDYLRPHFVMNLAELPRLANGKINEKELPGLDMVANQK